MFAQFKNHFSQQWRRWRTATNTPAGMAVGISYEATQIHALQLRQSSNGTLSLQHHAHVNHLPMTTQWGLAQASLEAIMPLLPTPTPALVLALPNHLVNHQYIILNQPHLSATEQIQWALQQEIDPETVAIDYVYLDEPSPDSSPHCLLCYTHKDAVSHYQNLAKAQQLALSCLDVEAFAALNAWYFWLNQRAPQHDQQVLALIHARPTDVTVYFCQRQRLLHQVNTPLLATPERPALWQQASDFIQQVWQRFHLTHAEVVEQAFITGRHSTTPALIEALRTHLSSPLTLAHPVLSLPVSAPLNPHTIEEHAPDLLIAFGLALRAQELGG